LENNKTAILQTTRISDQLSAPPYSALLSAGVIFVNGAQPRSRKSQKKPTSASLGRIKVSKRMVSPI
jgi:hypothetical protein